MAFLVVIIVCSIGIMCLMLSARKAGPRRRLRSVSPQTDGEPGPATGIRIGDRGRAATLLCPSGKVSIAGEMHEGRSEGDPIDADREVIVIGGDTFGLVVREVATGATASALKGQGRLIRTFREKLAIESAHQESEVAQEIAEERQNRNVLSGVGLALGFLFSVGVLMWQGDAGAIEAFVVLGLSVSAGLGVARYVEFLEKQLGDPVFPGIGAVLGAVFGAFVGVPLLGLIPGVLFAFAVAFIASTVAALSF